MRMADLQYANGRLTYHILFFVFKAAFPIYIYFTVKHLADGFSIGVSTNNTHLAMRLPK